MLELVTVLTLVPCVLFLPGWCLFDLCFSRAQKDGLEAFFLRVLLSALLTSAVALMHLGEPHGQRSRVGRTVLLAGMSALSFSLGDVLLQKWVIGWGSGRYLPPMFLFNALYTFAFVPFFRAPLRALDRRAWLWTGGGALLLAVNNTGIALSIAVWRAATSVNILYSLRGLISVVLVWLIGHWFSNEERHLAPRVFRYRLLGAALMLGAIVLVLL